jgi:FKBP-type peptidyl-prolyl cis-trans isomerase
MRPFLVLTLGLTLAACGTGTEPLTNDDFASELNVDLNAMTQTASGLYYQDVQVGAGTEATAGDSATVHYEGFLRNGTKFDSSRDRDQPFSFQLGVGDVIPGFDQAVFGMREGGIRKVVLPPNLAYGESGAPPVIPPNSTLVFDIELLSVTQ